MKLILGFDTATITGFSKYDIDKKAIIESGIINLSKKRGESNGLLFLRFSAWLEKEIKKKNIILVVYEQAHHRGGASTEIGVNLTGRIQQICEKYKIEYTRVQTKTLKLFATGKGNASKDEMIKRANQILKNRKVVDDNEADAIHVARWGAFDIFGIEQEGI